MKTKQLLKCFTLHIMNLKYMKVSLFEISKEKTLSPYSIFFRCTCIEGAQRFIHTKHHHGKTTLYNANIHFNNMKIKILILHLKINKDIKKIM